MGNILDKRFRFQPRRLVNKTHGSKVDFTVTLPNEIKGKEKKREAINPEPGIRNLLTQTDRIVQFMDNPTIYKGLRSLLFDD